MAKHSTSLLRSFISGEFQADDIEKVVKLCASMMRIVAKKNLLKEEKAVLRGALEKTMDVFSGQIQVGQLHTAIFMSVNVLYRIVIERKPCLTFLVPLLCEFSTTPLASSSIKSRAISKLASLLFAGLPMPLAEGVIETLCYLSRDSAFPDITLQHLYLSDGVTNGGRKKETIAVLEYMRKSSEGTDLLRRLGIEGAVSQLFSHRPDEGPSLDTSLSYRHREMKSLQPWPRLGDRQRASLSTHFKQVASYLKRPLVDMDHAWLLSIFKEIYARNAQETADEEEQRDRANVLRAYERALLLGMEEMRMFCISPAKDEGASVVRCIQLVVKWFQRDLTRLKEKMERSYEKIGTERTGSFPFTEIEQVLVAHDIVFLSRKDARELALHFHEELTSNGGTKLKDTEVLIDTLFFYYSLLSEPELRATAKDSILPIYSSYLDVFYLRKNKSHQIVDLYLRYPWILEEFKEVIGLHTTNIPGGGADSPRSRDIAHAFLQLNMGEVPSEKQIENMTARGGQPLPDASKPFGRAADNAFQSSEEVVTTDTQISYIQFVLEYYRGSHPEINELFKIVSGDVNIDNENLLKIENFCIYRPKLLNEENISSLVYAMALLGYDLHFIQSVCEGRLLSA